MSRIIGSAFLISFLFLAFGLAVSPVYGTVETVNISPSVLVVGQPITFSGVDIETISPNNPLNTVWIRVYPGFGCSFTPSNAIAFTIAPINPTGAYTGTYNTTLSFPAPVATLTQGYSGGGWVVTSQSYQNGLPTGSYSVGVTDTEASTNGAAGLCKNFSIVNAASAPEFSDPVVALCSVLACSMSLLLILRRKWGVAQSLE